MELLFRRSSELPLGSGEVVGVEEVEFLHGEAGVISPAVCG